MPISSSFSVNWRTLFLLSLLILPAANLAAVVKDHMGQSWTLYKQTDGQSYIYKVFPLYMDFLQAEANCQQFNAHLASFHSPAEFEFVKDLVKDVSAKSTIINDFWLGLYNKNEESESLTYYKIYFVDGTDFKPWKTYQYYTVDSNPDNGFSNKLSALSNLPETFFCMDYKADRPVDLPANLKPEEVPFEIFIHNLPCSVRLNAHVCKLPAEKAVSGIPTTQPVSIKTVPSTAPLLITTTAQVKQEQILVRQEIVSSDRTRGTTSPDALAKIALSTTVSSSTSTSREAFAVTAFLEGEDITSNVPDAETLTRDGSVETIVDQWENGREFSFYVVILSLLICFVIAALLVFLCCCHFLRRFSKGRYKAGTYYPTELKPHPYVSPTDYYTV